MADDCECGDSVDNMIDVENTSYVRYAKRNPLYKRVDAMKKHHLCGEKNIIYIVSNSYNASIRYRAENMIKTINQLSGYNAYLFEMANMNVVLSNLEFVDMMIFQRVIYPEIDICSNIIREKNIPILFDIDDFNFDSNCKTFKSSQYYGSAYEAIICQADMLITTTAFLQDRLRQTFNKKAYHINNFMDAMQYEISMELRKKRKQLISKHNFMIGYFGSDSHYRDLEMIAPELASFLERHRDAGLRIVGMHDIPSLLKRGDFKSQIQILPYMDGYKLMGEFTKLDINLIPLVMDDYSQARSEIKFFEAASTGVISIASPTQVYQKISEESRAIILCENSSWLDELEKVYNNQYDMVNMTKKAIKYVETKYTEHAMIPSMNRFVCDVEETYAEMLCLGNR